MKIDGIRKIFMIGDLHFGIRNHSVIWKNDMIGFVDEFLNALGTHGFNAGTDVLMLPGDIFHSREFLNVMIVHDVMKLFDRLTGKFARGVFVTLGNHDLYMMRNNGIHTMEFMQEMFKNLFVFPEAETLEINGAHNFLMMPWYDEIAKIGAAIDEHPECQYLFGHVETVGFKYNKVVTVEKGLDRGKLDAFRRAYLGHLHNKQESGNVLYLGTPYQLDRGDSDTSRGYYVITIEGDMLHEEYYENEWSPKYVSCGFDELMNMSFEQAAASMGKNYVDVRIPNSAARNFPMSVFSDAMQSRGICPRALEFKPYDDSCETDAVAAAATSDFDIAMAAKAILEERKYTHAEADGVLSYINDLHATARNNEKESIRQ